MDRWREASGARPTALPDSLTAKAQAIKKNVRSEREGPGHEALRGPGRPQREVNRLDNSAAKGVGAKKIYFLYYYPPPRSTVRGSARTGTPDRRSAPRRGPVRVGHPRLAEEAACSAKLPAGRPPRRRSEAASGRCKQARYFWLHKMRSLEYLLVNINSKQGFRK